MRGGGTLTAPAFTLAEVLVTLGIIGVVAAMTLPSLIAHNKTVESVERLKKAYSVLNQAYKMAELHYGEIENWDWNLSSKDFFNKYFIPYLNAVKNCEDNEGCWSDDGVIYLLNGNPSEIIKSNQYAKAEIADGTFIAITNQQEHAHFYIDTNGSRRPNTHGKDIFIITLTPKAFIDYAHKVDHKGLWMFGTGLSENELKTNCKAGKSGIFCPAYLYSNSWIIPKDYPRY